MSTVTINRDNLKNALRPIFQAAIKRRVEAGTWSHDNRDAIYSPSEWWVDEQTNGTIRHQLQTGISASASGSNITINLTFEILDISPSS